MGLGCPCRYASAISHGNALGRCRTGGLKQPASPAAANCDTLDLDELCLDGVRVVQKLTGPGAHVDDLLLETFVVALRHRRSFDPGVYLHGPGCMASQQTSRCDMVAACVAFCFFVDAFFSWTPPLFSAVGSRGIPIGPTSAAMPPLVHAALQKMPFRLRQLFALLLSSVDEALSPARLVRLRGTRA